MKDQENAKKRVAVTKESVLEAAMVQFKSELKVTQSGVLRIIGSGSEETVAKYLKEIKSELPHREITIFSPEIPLELVPVLESIYKESLKSAKKSFEEERDEERNAAACAMERERGVRYDLSKEVEQRTHLEAKVLELGYKLEGMEKVEAVIGSQLDEFKEAGRELSKQIDHLKKEHDLEKLKIKAEADSVLRSREQGLRAEIAEIKVALTESQARYSAEKTQTDFERERSSDETARLLCEIDRIKEQAKEDRAFAKDTEKRIGSELDISHAREDKLAAKVGSLEKAVMERDLLEEELSVVKSKLEAAERDAKEISLDYERLLSESKVREIMNKTQK